MVRDFVFFLFWTGGKYPIRQNRTVLKQWIVLSDDPDFPRLNRAFETVYGHRARGRRIQASDDAEQLRLADAARPQEAHNLTLNAVGPGNVLNLCADILEDGSAIVFEINILDLQQGFAVGVRNHNLVLIYFFFALNAAALAISALLSDRRKGRKYSATSRSRNLALNRAAGWSTEWQTQRSGGSACSD